MFMVPLCYTVQTQLSPEAQVAVDSLVSSSERKTLTDWQFFQVAHLHTHV